MPVCRNWMPMAISPILPGGISRDLLKPYCRCCMPIKPLGKREAFFVIDVS